VYDDVRGGGGDWGEEEETDDSYIDILLTDRQTRRGEGGRETRH
jgi:hypothetical protein